MPKKEPQPHEPTTNKNSNRQRLDTSVYIDAIILDASVWEGWSVKSPLRYPGGKSRVAKQIADLIPHDTETYAEPFLGGGSVLLEVAKRGRIKRMRGADIDQELINFWMWLRSETLASAMAEQVSHVRSFSESEIRGYLRRTKTRGYLHPDEFYILNRCSFSGTIRMGGLSPGLTRFTQKQIDTLTQYHELLKNVEFVLAHYSITFRSPSFGRNSKGFIFVDPPYFEIDGLYNSGNIDHYELCESLLDLDCKWVMTLNDHPEVRKLYEDCNIRNLEITYGMNNCSKAGKQKRATELLISNF